MMLLTDGFGGTGGISRFNRDYLTALDRSPAVTRVLAIPRLLEQPIEEEIPESVVYLREAAWGKFRYAWRLLESLRAAASVQLVVCGHINLLPLAGYAAHAKGARLALVIHGIEAWKPRRRALTLRLAKRVDGVISVSEFTAARFSNWSHVEKDRIFVLGNCVDIGRFAPAARDPGLEMRYGLKGCRVIMTLGRLASGERYKGIDQIIDILPALARKSPDIKYLVVGDGDDRARLEAKARALGVEERTVFAGHIAECEKPAHYNLAHAYVMPSSGEGFGIALLEAAACGVPVIGSRIDGSREALLDGALGRLVDPRDGEALAKAVLETIAAGERKRQPEAISRFAVPQFEAKVHRWLEAEREAWLAGACAA
ncbi:MAG: glycosyltransferase [Rhizomicrobium sp.]